MMLMDMAKMRTSTVKSITENSTTSILDQSTEHKSNVGLLNAFFKSGTPKDADRTKLENGTTAAFEEAWKNYLKDKQTPTDSRSPSQLKEILQKTAFNRKFFGDDSSEDYLLVLPLQFKILRKDAPEWMNKDFK